MKYLIERSVEVTPGEEGVILVAALQEKIFS